MDGFLLGLASGSVCFAYCAPPLVPYLLGTGRSVRANYCALFVFLSGRLAGYLLFAGLAWATHRLVVQHSPGGRVIPGVVYLVMAATLLGFSWRARTGQGRCAAGSTSRLMAALGITTPWLFPGFLGFLTGLNICPPFLVAFARAADYAQFLGTLIFFGAFFVGTSVFLMPLPLVGMVRGFASWQTIGRLCALVVGVFYLYKAVIMLGEGALL